MYKYKIVLSRRCAHCTFSSCVVSTLSHNQLSWYSTTGDGGLNHWGKALQPFSAGSTLHRELLRVAHVWPDVGLDVREHLLDVVAIVVQPLVKKLVHAQVADCWVVAAPLELRWGQLSDKSDAGSAERGELLD